MPRHPALIPLSHDHHHSLVLALRLKKAGPTTHKDLWPIDLEEQRVRTIEFCEAELLPHFNREEAEFFPLWREIAQDLIDQLLSEHAELRRMIEDLKAVHSDQELREAFSRLGILLERHIRLEERELFPLVEQSLRE